MAQFVAVTDVTLDPEDNVPEAYRTFRKHEEIPVHTGLFVSDINRLETDRWDRTGQEGAFINLYGDNGVTDLQLHELHRGGATSRVHHRYDELVYVTRGNGFTVIDSADGETVFEWQRGSLFSLPGGVPYRHVNGSETETARLVAKTTLPQLLNLLDHDQLFDIDDNRWDRYRKRDIYDVDASLVDQGGGRLAWDANFVPNIEQFDKLDYWDQLGAMRFVQFPMPESSMHAHIGEMPPFVYKNSHRHSPGATVCVLSGEGYSLLWREDMDERVKIRWGPGSIFTPPARWYHQHFNLSEVPARTLALKCPDLGSMKQTAVFDAHVPENVIDYTEESPIIREEFERELAAKELDSQMPAEAYTSPEYSFADLPERH